MKKKWLLLITMLLVLVFGQALAASAEEGEGIAEEDRIYPSILQDPSQYEVLDSDAPQSRAAADFEEYDETELFFALEEKIKEALLAGETSIDLTDMRIEAGKYQISQLVFFSPYLCDGIGAEFWYNSAGAYSEIKMKGTGTVDQAKAHIQKIDRAVAEILGQVSDGMSDEEKALVVHEFFASQYEYDYDNYLANTIPDDSYRSGGLFTTKTGVCQAYAYGYKYIMNMLGMECHVTTSDQMNHAWNIIKVDGAYYHVDCTWDDPVEDRLGLVGHKYFLVSDDAIEHVRTTPHTGWNLKGVLSCNNTKYDNAYWLDVSSPIVLAEDSSFYISYDSAKNTGNLYKDDTVIKELGKWNVWGNGNSYYTGAYSGLFLFGNELYYNTSTEIRKIDTEGQNDTLVHTPGELNQGYVYGVRKNEGKIEYSIKQTPDEKQTDANTFETSINLNPEVTGIILNKKALQLMEGETFTFEYTLAPDGMTSDVTWNSSETSVAGIDDKGKMTARKPGNTTITATTANGKSAKCEVTVTRKPVAITGITLNKTKLTLDAGNKETLAATIVPSDTTESKEVQWSSDNETVAKVTSGEVTAVSAGTAKITAAASNGMKAVCEVTVTGEGKPGTITGVTLDKSELSLIEGSSATLTAAIEPADTTDSKELQWSTSDEGVVKVENGKVTAVSAGEATVTVTTSNGKSAECKVLVTKKVVDPELPFVDVDDESWFADAVEFVYTHGIMTGFDSNHFGPAELLSRGQFVTILYRLEGEPEVEYSSSAFKDVEDGVFYSDAAMWAKETKVITGYDDGNFGPSNYITREQMAVIMFRYAQYKGFDTTARDNLSKFPDRNSVSAFAKEGISWAVGTGLITGDQGKINPQGNAGRAQTATIIQRFMTKYGD